MAEPPAKRNRTIDNFAFMPASTQQRITSDTVFERFFIDFEDFDILKSNLEDLCTAKQNALTVLEITSCNAGAGFGIPLCKASCETRRHDLKRVYPFGSVFTAGFNLLAEFLKKRKAPRDHIKADILASLLKFLLNKDLQRTVSGFQTNGDLETEGQISAALVKHLFLNLSTDKCLTLDERLQKDGDNKCSCGCISHRDNTQYSNTSFGIPSGWFGNLDVVLPHLSIGIESSGGRQTTNLGTSTQSDNEETRTSPLCHSQGYSTKSHILAQTILYAMLQKKTHPQFDHFLIPCIGASLKHLTFYFYDPEFDILLQSREMTLSSGRGRINYETIIALWLVLHYRDFSSGLSEDLKVAPHAKFPEFARGQLKVYENELSLGNSRNFSLIVKEEEYSPGYLPGFVQCSWPSGVPKPDFN